MIFSELECILSLMVKEGDQGSPQGRAAAQDYSVNKETKEDQLLPFAALFRFHPKIGVDQARMGAFSDKTNREGILKKLFGLK